MDWVNVAKIHTPQSAKRYSTLPLMSMRCTSTISSLGIHSRPQRQRSFWSAPNGARPLGTRAPGMDELSKVIADIAQRDGNVFFLFH